MLSVVYIQTKQIINMAPTLALGIAAMVGSIGVAIVAGMASIIKHPRN